MVHDGIHFSNKDAETIWQTSSFNGIIVDNCWSNSVINRKTIGVEMRTAPLLTAYLKNKTLELGIFTKANVWNLQNMLYLIILTHCLHKIIKIGWWVSTIQQA